LKPKLSAGEIMPTQNEMKETWERIAILETNVRGVQRCDEITKEKIDKLRDDATRLDERIASIRESVKVAKESMDMRLDSMNEIRGQLKDQANTFLPRVEYIGQHQALEQRFTHTDEDIRGLRESRATLEGKASQSSVMVAYIIAIVGIALSIIGLFVQFR